MRVMVIVKASKESEAGQMPSEKELADMGKYNEELVKAGRHAGRRGAAPQLEGQAGEILGRQADGHRRAVRRDEGADRWLLAVEGEVDGRGGRLAQACAVRGGAEVEIRPVFEAEDFGKEFTPELRAQEERLRAEMAAKK